MSARHPSFVLLAFVVVFAAGAHTQSTVQPVNDLPNPYQTVENYFKLPEGRTWGS
ncbi:MAG: hypothetical protein HYZ58_18910, partial [Acidobacteria bacterium]|nr:hypothetical protein [Acidobacteriota bacterium]